MNLISSKETAKKWGVSPRWVSNLAKEGRIPGAVKIGSTWMIPYDAEIPLDGRTANKNQKKTEYFRFPNFEYKDIDSFNPPLSDEELIIKKALEAFYECRFDEGNIILGNLPETAKNRYIRIYALRLGCACDILISNTIRFFDRFGKLKAELKEDFPHKKEMEECLHEVEITLGFNDYYNNKFNIEPDYNYHESFLTHLTVLNAVYLLFPNQDLTLKEITMHEVSCFYLEKEKAWCDLQSMHIYLATGYAYFNITKQMIYHFKQALLLADKYNLFYAPAVQYYYMQKPFDRVLKDFPKEFQKKFVYLSNDIHKRYLNFSETLSIDTIYRLLSQNYYYLLNFAVKGYTNKEISNILHISEGTIGKNYSEIYSILGVNSKKELIELFRTIQSKSKTFE